VSVDEYTIEIAGSPVFYRAVPGPAEPVLYLHGVPTSSADWTAALERTGGIAPDLIGFGRSGKGGHLDYSIDGYATFVGALLDALDLARVRLVVHDWGAVAGLVFAQRHPERIASLVVINAVPLLSGFQWRGPARIWRRPLVGELVMGSVNRRLLARTLRQGGPWPEERVREVWEHFDQGTQRAILRLHRDADEARLAAAGEHLGRLTVPALVIWGERDPWLPAELAERYVAALPGATLDRRPDAGHWPWLEQPAVLDRLAEFLA
jgi:pimeloyl-ACP methyl ester carboxylesterase